MNTNPAPASTQSSVFSLSAADQEPSLSRNEEVSTEAIAEDALDDGSDQIAMNTRDETKDDEIIKDDDNEDDDNTASGQKAGGEENSGDKNKDGVDSSVILQLQLPSQSQMLDQNHHNIDTAEATTANSKSLTMKLLESGGDIRALLLSHQPLSSLRAQTVDTAKESAGEAVVGKVEEEVGEVEEEERFVRPPRLRFAVSNEAASDGFPSAIARSLRWHPDHMQDRPEDAANMSIRAAFDTKFDEYYVFRHWRPSQGMPPINDVRLRWRSVMLMIAGHLDSNVPLTRVVCVALDQLPAAALANSTGASSNEEVVSSPSESLQKETSSLESGKMHQHRRNHQQGVVMDIEAIKWCHPEQSSGPVKEQELGEKETYEQQRKLLSRIFVRYAVTDSAQESNLVDREAIDNSAKELSDEGISQRRISCSLEEIQYAVSLLQEQEACVDEAYRTKWKEKSVLNGTVFRLSLLRPTLEPLFPYRTAQLKQRAERQAREDRRIEQLARRQRRMERMMELQLEEQQRKDELQTRLDSGEVVDRVCSKPGCEEWALLQCSRCPNACYCRVEHQRQDWLQRHGEVCRSEQYIRCALAACHVLVLVGYTDPSRLFQVNEETILCSGKGMDAASGLAAPVLRYFCSQAHCEEGKEDHEVAMKEYNVELAQKQSELERKQEEVKEDTGPLNEQQGAEWQQKTAKRVEDLKRERENDKLDSNDKDLADSTTTAADPGPANSPAEQPQRLKAASSLKGTKEGQDGEMDSATAKAAAAVATEAATAGASGVKQGGVSFDSTHSNDATAVLCSHPDCLQPGTKFCASCKSTGYCCAKCQKDDWPRHKESCEGRLLKIGKDYLDKAAAFHRSGDWSNLLKYCDLALTKLNLMKKKPFEIINQARQYKIGALRSLGRYEEAREISNNLNNIGASTLFLAAQNGQLAAVQKFLNQGADVNNANNDGCSPLWAAAANGHLAVVKCLIQHGADKNKANNNGATPLYIAALLEHLPVVKYLLEQGADKDKADNSGASPLLIAAHQGHLAVVKYLLEQGADKDKADNDGASPLYIAAEQGHLAVVQRLLEQGAEKDKDKATNGGGRPLNIAAQQGHLAVIQCLIEHGADKDKANISGDRPLFIAALQGHLPVVQYLLEQGADKEKTANISGASPLLIAALQGHLPVVQCLVEHGANKDKATNEGITPLHTAAHFGHAEILSYLLSSGASLTARDDNGRLPIDVAANERISELIQKEVKRREN